MILELKKIKFVTVSIVSPSICHEMMGPDAMILVLECWVLSQVFYSLLSLFIKRLFSSSLLSKGGFIFISEVTGISPGNLDSLHFSILVLIFIIWSNWAPQWLIQILCSILTPRSQWYPLLDSVSLSALVLPCAAEHPLPLGLGGYILSNSAFS